MTDIEEFLGLVGRFVLLQTVYDYMDLWLISLLNRKLESSHGHWFCPKVDSDDSADYSKPDEDDEMDQEGQYITAQTKKRRIAASKERHEVAYDYSLIFGFPEEQEQEQYKDQLNGLLSECDQCVRNYHMGRVPYLSGLSEYVDQYHLCHGQVLTLLGNFLSMKR